MIAVLGISSGCASDARFRRDRDIASIELDASVQSAFERVLDTSNSRRAKPDCDAIAINDGMLSLSPEPWREYCRMRGMVMENMMRNENIRLGENVITTLRFESYSDSAGDPRAVHLHGALKQVVRELADARIHRVSDISLPPLEPVTQDGIRYYRFSVVLESDIDEVISMCDALPGSSPCLIPVEFRLLHPVSVDEDRSAGDIRVNLVLDHLVE